MVRRGALPARLLTLLVVGSPAMLLSCSRSPSGPGPAKAPAALAPRQTVVRLIELRDERQYGELPRLVVPGRGGDVVEFLMAVDDFLASNQRLCNWLRDEVGVGISQTIDQSYVVDDLGLYAGEGLAVFSRGVELLDLVEDGNVARVSFMSPGRASARAVTLRKSDGVWRYDPGPGYSEHLAAAFHEMARGLELVRDELRHGLVSTGTVLDDPSVLIEKVRTRLRRGVGLLSRAQESSTKP